MAMMRERVMVMREPLLVDTEDRTFQVIKVAGARGLFAVSTWESDGRPGRYLGGFEADSEDEGVLTDEALLVIEEATG